MFPLKEGGEKKEKGVPPQTKTLAALNHLTSKKTICVGNFLKYPMPAPTPQINF